MKRKLSVSAASIVALTRIPFSVKFAATAAASFLSTASVCFFNGRDQLLTQLWIWRVCLLGKGRQSKADCQSYKGYHGARQFFVFTSGASADCYRITVVISLDDKSSL